jgi:acyl-CoA dehydrogenase
MSWGFETDPEYAAQLDWVSEFVTAEVEPLDQVIDHAWNTRHPPRNKLIRPPQQKVSEQKLWACHLGPELGGPGYGQLKLALLNERIGHTHSGPVVFGNQAPDSGNAEILAHFGSDDLKKRYLEPLLENEIASCYSMTEPTGGSDPSASSVTTRRRAPTPTCATRTCASRPTTCSAASARASRSRRPGSAEAASTTRCAPSAWCASRST